MSTIQHTNVAVWIDTKAKLERIAKHRRRSIVVTLDEMANEFAATNGIDISDQPAPTPPVAAQADSRQAVVDPVDHQHPVVPSVDVIQQRKAVAPVKRKQAQPR